MDIMRGGLNRRVDIIVRLLFFTTLFVSMCNPPIQGLTDILLAPKWYASTLALLIIVLLYACKHLRKGYRTADAAAVLPVAALLVLMYNMVYALVTNVLIPGVYDIHWVYLRGVFDNTTGFALNICLLAAMSLPLTMDERMHVWLRRVAYAVLLLAACAVFISGCRAGMLCVALMMGMLLAHVIRRRWLLWTVVGVILLAVSTLAMNMKNESTDGRRFILERTWELIQQKPLTGYGWHGFEREYTSCDCKIDWYNMCIDAQCEELQCEVIPMGCGWLLTMPCNGVCN